MNLNLFLYGMQAGALLTIMLGLLVFGVGGCIKQAWKEINE